MKKMIGALSDLTSYSPKRVVAIVYTVVTLPAEIFGGSDWSLGW